MDWAEEAHSAPEILAATSWQTGKGMIKKRSERGKREGAKGTRGGLVPKRVGCHPCNAVAPRYC